MSDLAARIAENLAALGRERMRRVAGEVIAINDVLEDAPETVNSDPYNDGWFFKLQPSDVSELEALLSAEDYLAQCAEDS